MPRAETVLNSTYLFIFVYFTNKFLSLWIFNKVDKRISLEEIVGHIIFSTDTLGLTPTILIAC